MDDNLDQLRRSLDRFDIALFYILAERFNTTRKIGIIKKQKNMPEVDPKRESKQFARFEAMSKQLNLDTKFVGELFSQILKQVAKEHKSIRQA